MRTAPSVSPSLLGGNAVDTSSLEKFALAARRALEEGVAQRLYALALDDDGRRESPAGSDVVRGRVPVSYTHLTLPTTSRV